MQTFLTKLFKKVRPDLLVLTPLILLSGYAHSLNMFGYPYIENDEATYTSRAYNYYETGELDVYTYRYDHAPLGWLSMGPALHLPQLFGLESDPVYTARVFMLAIHLASTVLLYFLALRLTGGKRAAGIIAVVIFSLSPLGIYFQRRVLLDNIMTFWVLASLYSTLNPKRRLRDFQFGALFFAFSILTKLNSIFLGPALLYLVFKKSQKENRVHAVSQWLMIGGFSVLLFFVYSMIKGEFLPAPIDPSTGFPTRVSLIDTFKLQLGRGESVPPWNQSSDFYQAMKLWYTRDWVIITLGLISSLVLAVISFLDKTKRTPYAAASALVMLMIIFLARGGIVLDLYVTPLIPLFALNIGLLVGYFYDKLNLKSAQISVALGLVLIAWFTYTDVLGSRVYNVNETRNQIAAIDWVRENVPAGSRIATDNFTYPALSQRHAGLEEYKLYYFFSAEYDFELRDEYEDDWRNFDYIILTHEMLKQIKSGETPRMKEILDHSVMIADFTSDSSSFLDFEKYISTNGDWARVYKVKDRIDITAQNSWSFFKSNYVISYGQVIDVTNNELTTSTAQTEAMLRAVEENDKPMFDGLRAWTKDHLQYRQTDKLFSWKWEKNVDGEYTLGDSNNVCDADQTYALALINAHKLWGGNAYRSEANDILDDFWNECVVSAGGKLIVQSSVDGSQSPFLVNPGYFDPSTYTLFNEFDQEHDWQKLIDDGYTFSNQLISTFGTLPDWAQVTTEGQIFSAIPVVGPSSNLFGTDSARGVQRLIEDASVNEREGAAPIIQTLYDDVLLYNTQYNTYGSGLLVLMAQQYLKPQDVNLQTTYEDEAFFPYDAETGLFGDKQDFASQIWYWKWTKSQDYLLGPEIRIL